MGDKHGHVLWNELNTHKPAEAAEFYKATLGLSVKEIETQPGMPPYRMLVEGDTMVAGVFSLEGPEFAGVPSAWLTYFAVEDADAAAARITEAGGHVLRGPFDVPKWGRMVVLEDAGGGVCAFIQHAPE